MRSEAGAGAGVRWLIGSACVLLLTACSVLEVVYSQADRLLSHAVDEYFDLTASQQALVDRQLADLVAWHRREELPEYVRFLAEGRVRFQRGLTAADLDWFFTGLESRYRRLVEHASDDAAVFLESIDDRQVERCREVLAERNDDWAAEWHLHDAPDRRLAWRKTRVIEAAEDWIGELAEHQREALERAVDSIPDGAQLRYQDRLRRQREFLALISEQRHSAGFRRSLGEWLAHWDVGRAPDYRQFVATLRDRSSAALLELDRTLTAGQRTHAAERIQGLIDDLGALTSK
jgi:hypothetical protein